MAGRARRGDDPYVLRMPVEADHPVRNAVVPGVVLGAFAVLFLISEGRGGGRGIEAPLAVALPVGVLLAVVVAGSTHVALRHRSRRHALVLDDDGIAFTTNAGRQWLVPWADVGGAQIVDATLDPARRPAFATFLVLDLDPTRAPRHLSLHSHEGRWWFPLPDSAGPVLHRELGRRAPGRVARARHQDGVPHRLAVRSDTPIWPSR